jgi:hypothetical protein
MYATQEYEGLERFETAISKDADFKKDIVESKDIHDLGSLIG